MTDSTLRTLDIWSEWAARPDWTVDDAAERVAASLQLVHATWPAGTEAFKVGPESKQAIPVDDTHLKERLRPSIKASRNRNLFKDNDLFGDGHIAPSPSGSVPLSTKFQQIAVGSRWGTGRAEVGVSPPLTTALTDRTPAVLDLMVGLSDVWQARNSWIDMTHVRQKWNRWKSDLPVYGWATWLHPDFATVDTSGLAVDVTEMIQGAKLIVLRVDPRDMADSKRDVGKDTIRQLAARTVLADGRPLPDVNTRLQEALQSETVA